MAIRGCFGTDVNRASAAGNAIGEAGSGLNNSGCANRHENAALVESGENRVADRKAFLQTSRCEDESILRNRTAEDSAGSS